MLNGAEAVVVQILSGRSASNSLFDNSRGGNHEGRLRADGSTVRSEEVFRRLIDTASTEEIATIVAETRSDYTETFELLLRQITAPKILFWLSSRPPVDVDDYSDLPGSLFQGNPQLVNRRMVQELGAFADTYVECTSAEGLPHKLWESEQPITGATLGG